MFMSYPLSPSNFGAVANEIALSVYPRLTMPKNP
jgi:hypothetical protein